MYRIDVRASHYKTNLPLLITVSIMAINTDNIAQGTCPVNSPELFSGLFRVRVRVKVRVRITIKFYISGFTCSVMYISSINPRLWFLTLTQYSTRQVMKRGTGSYSDTPYSDTPYSDKCF